MTQRIEELELKLDELEGANDVTPTWGAAVGARWEQIKGLRAEISRLRNAQSDAQSREPDDTKVICPNCAHQFRAISVADQARLRQSNAQPQDEAEAERLSQQQMDEYERRKASPPQDVLATARKRIQLVINEIADAELIMMLRTAMSEIDLAALAQSDAQPVAWQTVPKEPTREMLSAGDSQMPQFSEADKHLTGHDVCEDVWRDMIAAAPAPPRPDASGLLEAADMAHEKAILLRDPQSSAEMFEFEEELRRAAEQRRESVEWRSTPAMRSRIRELARPDRDDYDRAVIAVLDDFENMLIASEFAGV